MNAPHAFRLLAVVATASLVGLVGPAAFAIGNSATVPSPIVLQVPAPPPSPGDAVVEAPLDDSRCVEVVRPERTLKNGKVLPAKVRVNQECREQLRDEQRTERQAERQTQREERVALREQVREAGGTWGAVMRQEALIRVAAKLAERHEQTPTSAALGSILNLINSGLPAGLQFDIEAFLADYELVFADLIEGTDVDNPDIEPSPSPSVSLSPSA